MLWAITCIDRPQTEAVRAEHLAVHRAHLDRWNDHLVFSGPLQTDDAGKSIGSLYILSLDSRETAQSFVDTEPYNRLGIFASISIHRMRKGRYSPELAASA